MSGATFTPDCAIVEGSSDAELLAVLKCSAEYRATVVSWPVLPKDERGRLAGVVGAVEAMAALELARRGLGGRVRLNDIVERVAELSSRG